MENENVGYLFLQNTLFNSKIVRFPRHDTTWAIIYIFFFFVELIWVATCVLVLRLHRLRTTAMAPLESPQKHDHSQKTATYYDITNAYACPRCC